MEFFDRKDELRTLKRIQADSVRNARFTVLVGRRRIGKTELAESKKFTRIGSWWDCKGENEIDVIAENELSKTVSYYEVKRDPSRYSPKGLQDKVTVVLRLSTTPS